MLTSISQTVSDIITRLKDRKLGIAESCTGGLAASYITGTPGASAVFMGGVIAYANSVKQSVLAVPEKVLEDHGAVSAETALFMALGVKKLLNTTVSCSVTGIAGPDGGSQEKPVGTVYMAIIKGKKEYAGKFVFPGDRNAIQELAATTLVESVSVVLHNEIPEGFILC